MGAAAEARSTLVLLSCRRVALNASMKPLGSSVAMMLTPTAGAADTPPAEGHQSCREAGGHIKERLGGLDQVRDRAQLLLGQLVLKVGGQGGQLHGVEVCRRRRHQVGLRGQVLELSVGGACAARSLAVALSGFI